MNRIKRARGTNSVMTGVFYLIAVFFFALLISFASYVIIKGFSGATPARRLFPSPKNTRNTKYPNKPTTIDGNEESVSMQMRRNLVKNPFFAYIDR